MDFISTNFDESHFNSVNLDFYSLMDFNNNSIESEFNPLSSQKDEILKEETTEPSPNREVVPRISDKSLCSTSDSSSESVFESTTDLDKHTAKECCNSCQQLSVRVSLTDNSSQRTEHRKSDDLECESYDCHYCPDNHLSKDLRKIKRLGKRLGLLSGKKGPFNEKKLAHATAESRYRSSINEQIKRLKTLVAGPNANWKKSAILETVAEYIQQLKATNAKLIEENLQLKMKLSQSSGQIQATAHSYMFVPTLSTLPSLSAVAGGPQISTFMYSCI